MSVIIKIKDKDDIRRICIPKSSNLESLNKMLNQLFKIDEFVIKYVDDENDLVTISCDEELQEAFRLTKENTILRMYLSRQDGAQLNVSTISPLERSSSSIETTTITVKPKQEPVLPIKKVVVSAVTSTEIRSTDPLLSPNPYVDLSQKLAEHLKTTTAAIAATSVGLSNRIASDVTKLSEQTTLTGSKLSADTLKISEDLANRTSAKSSELSKNIAKTTAEISNRIAQSNEQLAANSTKFGEQMRKETMERSLLLSEQTSESLNRLSDSTVTMVDEASARIRAVIMNVKV